MLASGEDKFLRVSASQAVFLRVCRAVRDSAFYGLYTVFKIKVSFPFSWLMHHIDSGI